MKDRLRVLWVDDQIHRFPYHVEKLEKDFDLITATTPDEALEKAREYTDKIHVVLLNIQLPPTEQYRRIMAARMGIVLWDDLKKLLTKAKLIIFSGVPKNRLEELSHKEDDFGELVRQFLNDAITYVPKPSTPQKLESAVKAACIKCENK